MYYNSRKKTKVIKWQGIVVASILVCLGLFTFFDFARNLTNIILGIFGLMFYPLLILAILISFAVAFNMKFSMSGKNMAYLILMVVSLELLLHTAFVAKFASVDGVRISHYFDFLGKVATFESGLTVGGLIASLITYPFMCLLSSVGACIFFAILLTIFVALTVDYYLVVRHSDVVKNTKNKLSRNKANEFNYAFASENIGDTISNSNYHTDSATQQSLERFVSSESESGEDTYSEDESTSYVFDDYDETNEIIDSNKFSPTEQPSEGGYDLLADEKANSHYDPTKFSSVEEYIKYPYVPPIFKNNNEFKTTSLESQIENVDETLNEPDEYENLYSEDNDLEENVDSNVNNYLYNEDQEVSASLFTNSLDTSSLRDLRNEESRGRGRDSDSAFDSNPFTSFSVNSGSQERERGRNNEIFANPARDFFESTPRQKEEPEQIALMNMSKPKKYNQERDRKYDAPPTTLLEFRSDDESSYGGDYQAKSIALEQVLSSFNIDAKVSNVVRGPAVTQYELSMPYGTSVKKILSYDSDIAAALMSRGGVRIEAPILGKNAVGVEVPNDKRSTVGLREMLESKEFQNSTVNLPIVVGKGITGEVVVKSLPKLVHCLVAGSTGSGKSIFLHSIILSLMFKCSPTQLRFIMIDPKRVEFTGYSGMPHMMLPNAVCECDKAINALGWAVKEMDRRFKKLQQYQVQNIQDFNHCKAVTETHEEEPMAYLVIVIDELNDLMMVGKKEVEEKITRLAQLGRASGIHMIIATQRPSADVITGTIKNNLPTRVAFSLGSSVDSRVILDETGAEKLLGAGDMLLSAQDSNTTIRLQGGFMSMEEVRKVVEYIKDHNDSYFDEELEKEILADKKEEPSTGNGGGSSSYDPSAPDLDELLPAALKLCIETGGASINMVQRRFRVGYARAARIIDQMELAGYISVGNGSKLRTVHMTMSEFKEKFGDDV